MKVVNVGNNKLDVRHLFDLHFLSISSSDFRSIASATTPASRYDQHHRLHHTAWPRIDWLLVHLVASAYLSLPLAYGFHPSSLLIPLINDVFSRSLFSVFPHICAAILDAPLSASALHRLGIWHSEKMPFATNDLLLSHTSSLTSTSAPLHQTTYSSITRREWLR